MPWRPWLGAVPARDGMRMRTTFRVWTPRASALSVRIVGGKTAALEPDGEGTYATTLEGIGPGARYFYRFPDGRERPDPASVLQPEGVHGPSEVVDLAAIATRAQRPEVPLDRHVFCEIHLGTFTPGGTGDSAIEALPELVEARYTALEVMPVAAFPGGRNWGYDGVAPFAAHVAYGGPAALSRLVDAAHELGLVAFLDVVYNHLGPEGNYLAEFGPYFTTRHRTPWGQAINYNGADSGPVRRYFVENALRWVASAGGGFDGLRLDAVHSMHDESPERGGIHILRELNEAVQREARETGRAIHLIAESDLNEARLVEAPESGGHGLAAVWADDLHHALHAALTGEASGYYEAFSPTVEPTLALASAMRQGWHYTGQHNPFRRGPHGTPCGHLPGRRFVVFAQNHDQIGNRARGERLSALTSPGGVRVAAAIVALSPALPLFFQGEEWGAPEPFLYFVSHGDHALIEAVRRGRRAEFRRFASFEGEIPDPQSEETFLRSKLDRAHRRSDAGQASLRWHHALLDLRREHPALRDDRRDAVDARSDRRALLLRRWAEGKELLLVALFEEVTRTVALPAGIWRVLLDSSAGEFGVPGGVPARLEKASLWMCGRQAVVLERAA